MEKGDIEFYELESTRDHRLPWKPSDFEWEVRKQAQEDKRHRDQEKLEAERQQTLTVSSELIESSGCEFEDSVDNGDNEWKLNEKKPIQQ